MQPRRHNRSHTVIWDLSIGCTWHIPTPNGLGQKWGWVLAQDAEFCLPSGWVPGIKGARRTQISSCFIIGHVSPMAVSRPHTLRDYTGWIQAASPLPPLELAYREVSKVMARIVARDGDHDGVKRLKSLQAQQKSPKCVLEHCKHISPAQ